MKKSINSNIKLHWTTHFCVRITCVLVLQLGDKIWAGFFCFFLNCCCFSVLRLVMMVLLFPFLRSFGPQNEILKWMCYSRANTLRANKNDFIASLFQLIMKLPPTGTFSYACVCESFAVIQYKSCRLTAQTIKHKTKCENCIRIATNEGRKCGPTSHKRAGAYHAKRATAHKHQ